MPAPAPVRGVAASTLQLPPGPWSTVLEALCGHFPAIPCEVWRERMRRGLVSSDDGAAIGPDHAYRTGLTVHYFREVESETPIPFAECVLFQDEHLVVADKPHFLPVTPAGAYVAETLLARLVHQLGNADLVPLHRIDRLTAGLVLFSARPDSRRVYQDLFRTRQIEKHYEALAPALPEMAFPLTRRTRLVAGEPFFRICEVAGAANTETRIEVVDRTAAFWRYRLTPITGKKHQLRVHMAALGAPILNDDLYPDLCRQDAGDFSRPLKLLARGLAFVDPVTGGARRFESQFSL